MTAGRVLVVSLTLAAAAVLAAQAQAPSAIGFTVVEAGIADLQAAMTAGRVTSRQITAEYLARIARYDGTVHATLAVSPRALDEADALDRERTAGRVRGPLHGIPIALKDNIHTTDLPTTGGALAFRGYVPPYEATLVAHLRAAGAIVIAKTGMTELANWMAAPPTPMPSGYNAMHGLSLNPYDPRLHPLMPGGRAVMSTGGSSSGVGTAANLWAANVGTETSGSILSPANQTMLAAVKPTVGRISRYGVMPIVSDQDTPGPMAKTVRDVAIMLGVLEGATPDPRDPAPRLCSPPPGGDYTAFLRTDALEGTRIGVPRTYFYQSVSLGVGGMRGGLPAAEAALMEEAIGILRGLGAVVIDPSEIPSVVSREPGRSLLAWDMCSGIDNGRGGDAQCSTVLKYGMKRDFNAWLATLGKTAPVATLTALREWNIAHQADGSLRYGQANLDISDEMDVARDRARYEADRALDVRLAATEGIDRAIATDRLDALLFPGVSGSAIAARAGYPTVMVPFGLVPNASPVPFPDGFDAKPRPFGVSFTGTACAEPRLLALAYAFEQATRRRVPPAATP